MFSCLVSAQDPQSIKRRFRLGSGVLIGDRASLKESYLELFLLGLGADLGGKWHASILYDF